MFAGADVLLAMVEIRLKSGSLLVALASGLGSL